MPRFSTLSRLVPLALAGALACAGPEEPGLQPAFGKAPSDPTVTATDPDTAVQDTTLDVTVIGTGFDNGSVADWLLAGVADPRVRTNSTRYVSSRSLVANITIAKDAVPAAYDVRVTTSTGKKGIGTERFVVELRDPSANFEVGDAAGMKVTSDGRGAYVGNTCGVGGRIYIANGGGDAVFTPYQTSPTTSPLCGGTPRVLNINLGGTLGTPGGLGDEHRRCGPPRDQPDAGSGVRTGELEYLYPGEVQCRGGWCSRSGARDLHRTRWLRAPDLGRGIASAALRRLLQDQEGNPDLGWSPAGHPVPDHDHGGLLALGHAELSGGSRRPGISPGAVVFSRCRPTPLPALPGGGGDVGNARMARGSVLQGVRQNPCRFTGQIITLEPLCIPASVPYRE